MNLEHLNQSISEGINLCISGQMSEALRVWQLNLMHSLETQAEEILTPERFKALSNGDITCAKDYFSNAKPWHKDWEIRHQELGGLKSNYFNQKYIFCPEDQRQEELVVSGALPEGKTEVSVDVLRINRELDTRKESKYRIAYCLRDNEPFISISYQVDGLQISADAMNAKGFLSGLEIEYYKSPLGTFMSVFGKNQSTYYMRSQIEEKEGWLGNLKADALQLMTVAGLSTDQINKVISQKGVNKGKEPMGQCNEYGIYYPEKLQIAEHLLAHLQKDPSLTPIKGLKATVETLSQTVSPRIARSLPVLVWQWALRDSVVLSEENIKMFSKSEERKATVYRNNLTADYMDQIIGEYEKIKSVLEYKKLVSPIKTKPKEVQASKKGMAL